MTEQATTPSVPADGELGRAIRALAPWQMITISEGAQVSIGTISIAYTPGLTEIVRAHTWIGSADNGRWLNLLTEHWSA